MQISILWMIGLFLQAVVSGRAGINLQGTSPGVILAPVWRKDRTRSVVNDHVRRDSLIERATSSTVGLTLDNPSNKLLYYANSREPFQRFVSDETSYNRHTGSTGCIAT